jgi:GxxExxY protein
MSPKEPQAPKEDKLENDVARHVVDAAYRIHTALGPGLLESAYESVLAYELTERGLHFARQALIPIVYHGVVIEQGFRADFIVEDKVIVEIESIDSVAAVHKKQLLTYLKLSNRRLGLLINFNEMLIKDGITRLVNGLDPAFRKGPSLGDTLPSIPLSLGMPLPAGLSSRVWRVEAGVWEDLRSSRSGPLRI